MNYSCVFLLHECICNNIFVGPNPFLFSVQKFISEDRLPHLLFYGPPGTGKTSTVLASAKQLYKEKEFNAMVLEVRNNSALICRIIKDKCCAHNAALEGCHVFQ